MMGDDTKHVFVVNADGSAAKDLGLGAVPSWSPDDKQITFSQSGIWIMNADGTGRRQIDTSGFGSQWSPKGGQIAYTTNGEDDKAFRIYDVTKNQPRDLPQTRYHEIYYGATWSPDGKWLCMKGLLPDGNIEISAMCAEGEEKGFRVLLPSSAQPEVLNSYVGVSWGGDGKQILIDMQKTGDRGRQLYVLDSEGARPPRLFPNFPPGWTCNNPCWSADGKKIVMSVDPVEPSPRDANAAAGDAVVVGNLDVKGVALGKPARAAGGIALNPNPAAQKPDANEKEEASTLDLSSAKGKPVRLPRVFESFAGRQVIDGMPFQIDGNVSVYGKMLDDRNKGVYPFTRKGIRIGRKFDCLYLIHHAYWPDVEGATIAYAVLNYADGTEHIIPIRYGVHVRDWFNLPSYEKEAVSDPDTTICWRHEPATYKAPVRLFESRFENPSPDIVVASMDIVSARSLAAYNLLAATVANHRTTPAPAVFSGDRKFDRRVVIRVVDATTGQPIEGALVLPGMTVQEEGVVGSPFLSSSAGKGTIPYPSKDTTNIYATVEKKGYQSESTAWQSAFPDAFTFRLKRVAEK
jgi:hypothetical protein